MTITTAYSYTRLSTEKQLKGQGYQRQREAFETACCEHGWTPSEQAYEDLGVSARKGANAATGALSCFIKLAEEGSIPQGSILVVESVDRLSRQPVMDSLNLFLRLLATNVHIYTLTDKKLYTKDSPNAMTDIMSFLVAAQRAFEESETKSIRIKDTRGRAKKAARENGTIMKRRLPAWLAWAEGRELLEVVPEVAEVVTRIFEMYANGLGCKPIAMRLNDEGVAYWGRRGAEWTYTVVRNILKQESVTGRFQPLQRVDNKDVPDGEPIDNYYPRIISQELWATTVNLRATKATSKGRHTEDKEMANLFKGVLKCACGSGIALNSYKNKKTGKRYYHLRCSELRSGSCKEKNWNYGAFEDIALLGLMDMDWSALISNASKLNDLEEMGQRKEVLELELRELDNKVKNILDAISKRKHSQALLNRLDEYEAKQKEVSVELDKVTHLINSVETANQAKDDKLDEIQRVLEEVKNSADARYKANQVINKHFKEIRLGSVGGYTTMDQLKDATLYGTDKKLLPEGRESMHGYIEFVPTTGDTVRVEVLKGYTQSFVWDAEGNFTEFNIDFKNYNKVSVE